MPRLGWCCCSSAGAPPCMPRLLRQRCGEPPEIAAMRAAQARHGVQQGHAAVRALLHPQKVQLAVGLRRGRRRQQRGLAHGARLVSCAGVCPACRKVPQPLPHQAAKTAALLCGSAGQFCLAELPAAQGMPGTQAAARVPPTLPPSPIPHPHPHTHIAQCRLTRLTKALLPWPSVACAHSTLATPMGVHCIAGRSRYSTKRASKGLLRTVCDSARRAF